MLSGIVPDYIIMLLYILSNLNAFCNIFIYAMRHIEIKTAIVALFKCKSMPSNLEVWKCNKLASQATKSMKATTGFQITGGQAHIPPELIEIG